jgi:hypothetical protein
MRVLDTGANDIEASDEITADEAEILRDFEATPASARRRFRQGGG